MKLDNKGFAITGFLYSVFAIFLVILSLLLISMTNSKITLERVKKNIKIELDDPIINKDVYEKLFSYTGSVQNFVVPYSGWYKIELWGAKGCNGLSKGAYVSGKIHLNKDETIYVYVGEGLKCSANSASFNGGTGSNGGTPGGGATDIRYGGTSLNSRIIVAAGSGSGAGNNVLGMGDGGALVGVAGGGTDGGTQTTFGAVQESGYTASSFGVANGGCAGGNGYYPGGGATCSNGAGGGSSFISGYAGVNAITSSSSLTPTNNTIHYSGKYFIDGEMQIGVNDGNGRAKITYMSETKLQRINTKLNDVRYIKDCINGNSVDSYNLWTEIQAIKNGINIAKGIIPSGTSNYISLFENQIDFSAITDGDFTENTLTVLPIGEQCVTLDLGKNYDLDEIAIWHSWIDGRTFNNNITSISSDNSNWTTVINTTELETANGKRVNAYNN